MYEYKMQLFPTYSQHQNEIVALALTAEASQDLQSGKLAHISEGGIGQRTDLVVAQVSKRKMTHTHTQTEKSSSLH